MAHDYGIFWLENKGDGKWVKHMIDDSWSQPHAMSMVDFRETIILAWLRASDIWRITAMTQVLANRWECIGMSG